MPPKKFPQRYCFYLSKTKIKILLSSSLPAPKPRGPVPLLYHSNIPTFQHSTIPVFQYSSIARPRQPQSLSTRELVTFACFQQTQVPRFQYSSIPVLLAPTNHNHYPLASSSPSPEASGSGSSVPLFHYSIIPFLRINFFIICFIA